MYRKVCIMLLVAVMGLGITQVFAADPTPENPLVLRFAYADNATWPETSEMPEPEHAYGLIFKSYVETYTNGAIKIELYPSNQLGSHKEMMEMVQSGAADFCIETGTMGPFFPEYQVINIPYVFRSDEVAWWVFDNSQFWKDLMDKMEKEIGLISLGMGQNGVRNFTNNVRPIHEPKDMEGIKFRVMQSPVFVKTVEALGAKAIPIAWTEVYTSLQTGVIDGQENPIATIVFVGKLHEVQKYFTMDGHTWSENMLLMNAKKFRSLSEENQQILRMAGLHGARADRTAEAFMSRVMGMETLQANMEVYTPTAAEVKKFQDAAQPAVIEWLKEEVGSEVVDEFLKAVEEAEMALGYK